MLLVWITKSFSSDWVNCCGVIFLTSVEESSDFVFVLLYSHFMRLSSDSVSSLSEDIKPLNMIGGSSLCRKGKIAE